MKSDEFTYECGNEKYVKQQTFKMEFSMESDMLTYVLCVSI
jgi:hypothetical protein